MKTTNFYKISLVAVIISAASFNASAARYSIDVRNFLFSPSTLENVRVGDTIHWEWKEGSHTTTSTSIPSGAASWDSPISSSVQSFDYIPTVTGTYNYKCTPHATMGMTGSFTVAEPQGLSDKPSPVTITIYPNPFYENLTVKFSSEGGTAISQIRIYDITGRMVARYEFPEGQTHFEKELSSATLPEGLLFFEFRGTDGKVFVRRVVRE